MTIRNMPAIQAFTRPEGMAFEPGLGALDRWNGALRAADSADSIDIFDVIGVDWWTGEGITAKAVAAALKGRGDVVVNINSPGGDFFEGVAIYNLLREHKAKVTVNVVGLAASAASVIAMAGDEVRVARAGFLMIHNAWIVAVGDRHDMADAVAFLEPFDDAMAKLYGARTGKKTADIVAWMDNETWFDGDAAVANGFADALLPSDAAQEDPKAKASQQPVLALRRVDAILAHQGLPRSERRRLIAEIKGGKPGAAATAMPDAGLGDLAASLRGLIATMKPKGD